MGARLCLPARFCVLLSFSLVCLLPCCPPQRSWQLKSALDLLNTEAARIRPLNACHGQRLYQWFVLSQLHRHHWRSSEASRMRWQLGIQVCLPFYLIPHCPSNHARTPLLIHTTTHCPACYTYIVCARVRVCKYIQYI